jgi:hypothetical protein
VRRAKVSGELVEGVVPDEYSRGNVERAVFGIEILDRCTTARRIAFAEDLLKVAVQEFVDTI